MKAISLLLTKFPSSRTNKNNKLTVPAPLNQQLQSELRSLSDFNFKYVLLLLLLPGCWRTLSNLRNEESIDRYKLKFFVSQTVYVVILVFEVWAVLVCIRQALNYWLFEIFRRHLWCMMWAWCSFCTVFFARFRLFKRMGRGVWTEVGYAGSAVSSFELWYIYPYKSALEIMDLIAIHV